jgi:aldose 1-epimerase
LLGYDDIKGYYNGKSYFGCVVGRFANRIAKATFKIDGKEYHVPQNDGLNSLHGGINSIDKQVWDARIMNDAIRFTTVSKDGDNGYPGNLKITVVYSLRSDNSLSIDYSATTDQATVLNISNHAYFNLTGEPSNTILDHEIKINADAFTPVDSTLIPTGELKKVAGTAFDFLQFKKIGKDINQEDQQLIYGKGYDHNFALNAAGIATPVVEVQEKTSGRKMEVFTTQPGVQFYTGNFLNGSEKGRGVDYKYRTGFCLETQHFPDAPNQPNFPSTVLKPGETWKSQTIYKFSVLN